MSPTPELKRSLGALAVWGMGVGYVISGMYFGWNLGLPQSGPYGMLVAMALITVMAFCFVLSYAELASAIPRAGGVFVFAERALGGYAGFLAGLAQNIEFVFAPPAIAASIGAYLSLYLPQVHPVVFAMIAYALFTGLNIWGVRESTAFGVFITVLAVVEILIFAGITLPHFNPAKFSINPLPSGWWGVLPAVPFAMWFYLGIEGVANMAEDVKNPKRDLALGFKLAIATLALLVILVFFGAIGIGGWAAIVYPAGSTATSDSPLPLALAQLTGSGGAMYHLLVSIGLLGLIASFHGILWVAGRTTMELGRARYIPSLFAQLHNKRQTPAWALLLNMILGAAILLSGKTSEMITLATFGALTIYILSLISFFYLRKLEPRLERPFRTPLYPFTPALALIIAIFALGAMVYFNLLLGAIYLSLLAAGSLYFRYRIMPVQVKANHGRDGRL